MTITLVRDDVRHAACSLPSGHFRAIVTSVPYWMQRIYLPLSHPEAHLEIGRESTPSLFVEALADVFDLLRPRCGSTARSGSTWAASAPREALRAAPSVVAESARPATSASSSAPRSTAGGTKR